MRIAVTGATGQMGSNVIISAKQKDIEIGLAVDREETEKMGVTIQNDEKLQDLLEERDRRPNQLQSTRSIHKVP